VETETMKDRLISELNRFGLGLQSPIDEIFAEEIRRTCLIDSPVERVYALPAKFVLVNDRLVGQCCRIFDITASSVRCGVIHDIEGLKRISAIGYSLHDCYVVYPRHESSHPRPSTADLVAFFATDATLGASLNYVVISVMKDNVSAKRFNFGHCFRCASFPRLDALVDSRIDQERGGDLIAGPC
jgi:hypothetical protein